MSERRCKESKIRIMQTIEATWNANGELGLDGSIVEIININGHRFAVALEMGYN